MTYERPLCELKFISLVSILPHLWEKCASACEVLVLYRKRESAMRRHEHGGVARFRYSDLKEAARFAADAVVMQIQMGEE
jgi:hypothetical protein